MDILLEAKELTKRFGAFTAVDGISLQVKKGEVLGFLGPNGAGKSTTMKMLTGFLAPSSGSAIVCGETVTTGNVAARARIGYLPEGAPLYGDMTSRGFLAFVAAAHAIPAAEIPDVVESAAGAVHLQDVMEQRVETLSKGFKRRVGLAAAILHAPDVLILDEPTDGLDPNQKFEVRRLIEAMSVDRAIIISTHILEEVDALCHRAVIINRGHIVADGTPSELRARSRYRNAVTMLVPGENAERVASALKRIGGVAKIEAASEGNKVRLTVVPVGNADIAEAIGDIAAVSNWQVSQFSVDPGRLDDVFRQATEGDGLNGNNHNRGGEA
ncbi:ABC transporter ATP-binding protein [Kordiimonas aestuarii]|uniref:ABC transporter ATP-binding protein n=1 Tax=Kordiimonas aestuarii TaxID=1005925 RepID=UPI0021D2A112|nr:ABC transporter ATP-binding protein [Kordiimonas aestuarii]